MKPRRGEAAMLDVPAPDAAEAGQWVAVACRCGHRTALGPWTYGAASCRLRDLGRLLRCRECGTRGAVRVWLTER
jgi:hypothetical protein